MVFARSYEALSEHQLRGAGKLTLVFREAQWASLLGAMGLLGSLVWAPLECWVARVVCVWILAVCVEHLVRVGIAWRMSPGFADDPFLFPLRLAVFAAGARQPADECI